MKLLTKYFVFLSILSLHLYGLYSLCYYTSYCTHYGDAHNKRAQFTGILVKSIIVLLTILTSVSELPWPTIIPRVAGLCSRSPRRQRNPSVSSQGKLCCPQNSHRKQKSNDKIIKKFKMLTTEQWMSWEWNPPWSGSAFLSVWSLPGWGKPRNPHFQVCRKGESLRFNWNRGMSMPCFSFWLVSAATSLHDQVLFFFPVFLLKRNYIRLVQKITEILVFSKIILSCGFSKFLQVKEILMKALEHWVFHTQQSLPF